MGAPVRESDDGEPSKSEPLKSEPLKREPLKRDAVKREAVKNELSRNESPKPQSLKPESLRNEPSRNPPSKDESKNVRAAPSSGPTEMSDPPWKRKTRRSVFEGDVAVIELRSRLALGPERIPEPTEPTSNAPAFGGDRKSTRLNSSHRSLSRMPSSA